jgi:hypothetical protein
LEPRHAKSAWNCTGGNSAETGKTSSCRNCESSGDLSDHALGTWCFSALFRSGKNVGCFTNCFIPKIGFRWNLAPNVANYIAGTSNKSGVFTGKLAGSQQATSSTCATSGGGQCSRAGIFALRKGVPTGS